MEFDEYTGKPINVCKICKKEVIGWVDEPTEEYICESCEIDDLCGD